MAHRDHSRTANIPTVTDIPGPTNPFRSSFARNVPRAVPDRAVDRIVTVEVPGPGSGGPTGTYAEDATAEDHLQLITANPEDATVDDEFARLTVATAEDASVDDLFAAIVAGTYAEDATVNDLTVVSITSVDVPRTGTPDTDPLGDAWTNQLTPGANNGNANLSVRGRPTLADEERRGYLMIDLTWATGFVSTGSGFSLSFTVSHNASVPEDIRWASSRHAARPFTESTVTWSAPPPAGTGVTGNANVAVANGAAQRKTIGIAAGAGLDACLGQWLLITFTGIAAALPAIFTIVSRDQAANRPLWSIDIQRGT